MMMGYHLFLPFGRPSPVGLVILIVYRAVILLLLLVIILDLFPADLGALVGLLQVIQPRPNAPIINNVQLSKGFRLDRLYF
jgi:hypothetical protein